MIGERRKIKKLWYCLLVEVNKNKEAANFKTKITTFTKHVSEGPGRTLNTTCDMISESDILHVTEDKIVWNTPEQGFR